jgi:SET domain-containing protein
VIAKQEYPAQYGVLFKDGRGYGVCAGVDIKFAEFINEYVGEIIDKTEKNKRDDNKIMWLSTGLWLDAGYKGNLSRFYNHSCDPNCGTQSWEVNGCTRIGFFARKDIAKGK